MATCEAGDTGQTAGRRFRSLGIQAGYVQDNLSNIPAALDPKLNIVPDLAELWEVQEGGQVYLFWNGVETTEVFIMPSFSRKRTARPFREHTAPSGMNNLGRLSEDDQRGEKGGKSGGQCEARQLLIGGS